MLERSLKRAPVCASPWRPASAKHRPPLATKPAKLRQDIVPGSLAPRHRPRPSTCSHLHWLGIPALASASVIGRHPPPAPRRHRFPQLSQALTLCDPLRPQIVRRHLLARPSIFAAAGPRRPFSQMASRFSVFIYGVPVSTSVHPLASSATPPCGPPTTLSPLRLASDCADRHRYLSTGTCPMPRFDTVRSQFHASATRRARAEGAVEVALLRA